MNILLSLHGTDYYLAQSSKDYGRVGDYLRANKAGAKSLSYPTIFAQRRGEIIGTFSTRPNKKKGIIAGPMHCTKGGFTVMRLTQIYDGVLKHAGIRHYFVHIKNSTGHLQRIVEKLPYELHTEIDGARWYKRTLQ